MRRPKGIVVAGLCSVALLGVAGSAGAAPPPVVYSVLEGRPAPGANDQLVVVGDKLTKATGAVLRGPSGDVPLAMLLKNKNLLVFEVPEGTAEGNWQLVIDMKRAAPLERAVTLTNGNVLPASLDASRLSAPLRGDLDDAATLGGEPPSAFHDASKIDAGTLDAARFSAYDDLVAESKIGAAAGQLATGDHAHDAVAVNAGTLDPARFSAYADLVAEGKIGTAAGQIGSGDHTHDERYFTEMELAVAGVVNAGGNPVDWTKLKGVPAGFADGTDADTTYDAGTGLALAGTTFSAVFGGNGAATSLSRSDHDHDASYFTKAALQEAGAVNTATNPVDWTKLKTVPAGFADGVDADTTYTAGNGLAASGPNGTTFTVDYGGTGTAKTVAHSDHDHDTQYFTQTTLQSGGTINTTGNPVDWTKLKRVPSGFADGVDDASNWTASGSDVYRSSGRVGIGNTAPAAGLHVTSAAGVLFEGTTGGGIPATGAGIRMMWHPAKRAFRAGQVAGTKWDDSNVGLWSVAMGNDTVASGNMSTAMGGAATASGELSLAAGSGTTASGTYSTATGFNSVASGSRSVAMGSGATASGTASTAMGDSNTAQGNASFAMGWGTFAAGNRSTAMGDQTFAEGDQSTAMGWGTFAGGNCTTALGSQTNAQAFASVALGACNVTGGNPTQAVSTDPVLVVGNGTSIASRSNAFTLLRNGNLTIAGTLTQNSDERLKESVEELSGVLERLKSVRGVSYRFRKTPSAPDGRHVGLLAQEVKKAFPELVTEYPNGTLSVAYGNFTAVLLEAVKEQQAEIEAQREAAKRRDTEMARRDAEVERLAATVAALSKRLEEVEARK